jgi:RND superfamily putative drug exporter
MQALAGEPSGHANQLIEAKFTSGLLAPVQAIMTGSDGGPMTDSQAHQAGAFVGRLSEDHRVSYVLQEVDNGRMVATVILNVPIDSDAATELVDLFVLTLENSRPTVGPLCTSAEPPLSTSISPKKSARSHHWFSDCPGLLFCVPVSHSAVYCCRSKPSANLLAIAATMGVTVAVFQWGTGESSSIFVVRASYRYICLPSFLRYCSAFPWITKYS